MRSALLALTLVVSVTAPTLGARPHRVRPVDRASAEALRRGQDQSPLFRELVQALEASDLIVHVVATDDLPPRVDGATRFVALLDGARYVRVTVRASLPGRQLVAMLAHELQHARELAESGARSAAAVRALYRRIGTGSHGLDDGYETTAAIDAGLRVWDELINPASPPRATDAGEGPADDGGPRGG